MTIKPIYIFLFLLLSLSIIGGYFQGCLHRSQMEEKQATIDSLMLANQTLTSFKNAANEVILQQEAIVVSSQESLKKLTDSVFNLKRKQEKEVKNIIAYYKGVTKTHIDSVLVPFHDTTYVNDSTHTPCIPVGATASDSTATYSASMTVQSRGIQINHLSIPDSTYLEFVQTKHKLFKPSKTLIFIKHTSPHVTQTSANSVLYKPVKKNVWLRNALFVAGGVLIGLKL